MEDPLPEQNLEEEQAPLQKEESLPAYEIKIEWRSLSYSENGEEPVKIYIQPPNSYGKPFTFYIPGPARWQQFMPHWAVHRRDEIVARIKDECMHYYAEWVEG